MAIRRHWREWREARRSTPRCSNRPRLLGEQLETRRLLTASYTITELGTIPAHSVNIPVGINATGQVAGTLVDPTNEAYLYSAGTMQGLGTLGGDMSIAQGINDSGQVVGYSVTADGYEKGFLYSNGSMQSVGQLGIAAAINDNGQIAGQAIPSGFYAPHAVIYSNGTMQDLGTPTGFVNSIATGINDSGEVVGYAQKDDDFTYHAFLYSDGAMQDLGTLAGLPWSQATAVNAQGNVIGRSYSNDGTVVHAFLYSGGTMHDLGTLGGTQSFANGINVNNQVVGYSLTGGEYHAFLDNKGVMLDLNSLIDPASKWHLTQANAINDAGQIVGDGIDPSGQSAAFLLTPVKTLEVSGVSLDGTTWSSSFLAALQAAGQGNGTGYTIPGGASQLKDVPWDRMNQIQIQFNENVKVQEWSLATSGGAPYIYRNFSYNSTTFTATWTLANPIGADRISLDLQTTGPYAVTDAAGHPLDGEWTNGASVYPSGDRFAGGDFSFAFNVLPGDGNGDGVVNGLDIASVASHWLHTGTVFGDANGDGAVNGLDVAEIASHWLQTLPAAGNAGAAVSLSDQTGSGAVTNLSAASSAITAATAQAVDHVAAFVGRPEATAGEALNRTLGWSSGSEKINTPGAFAAIAVVGTDRVLAHNQVVRNAGDYQVDEQLLSTLSAGQFAKQKNPA